MLEKNKLSDVGERQIERLLDYLIAKEKNDALKLEREKKNEESTGV